MTKKVKEKQKLWRPFYVSQLLFVMDPDPGVCVVDILSIPPLKKTEFPFHSW